MGPALLRRGGGIRRRGGCVEAAWERHGRCMSVALLLSAATWGLRYCSVAAALLQRGGGVEEELRRRGGSVAAD